MGSPLTTGFEYFMGSDGKLLSICPSFGAN